ncbi:MAG: helix-turn-helix transcriptional regulator [Desulfobacter sp.]
MDITTTGRIQRGTLLSIKDVQIALNCGKAKAWKLVRDGHLTRIKFGSRMTRFRSEQVLELMEKGV